MGTPSRRTRPDFGFVKPTRTRRRVLFPDPEGPIRLTISPFSTENPTPVNTGLSSLYEATMFSMLRYDKFALHPPTEPREGVGNDKVKDEDRAEHQDRGEPFVVENLSRIRQFNDADLGRQGRVLDEGNEKTEGRGQNHFPRLGDDHQPELLGQGEVEHLARIPLGDMNGLDPGPNDLCDEPGGNQADGNQGHGENRELE